MKQVNQVVQSVLGIAMMVAVMPVMAQAAGGDKGGGADRVKIGFVDAERVARESAPGKAAQQKLESEFSTRLNELRTMNKSLTDRRSEMDKSSSTWTDAQKKDKEREFEAMARDFQGKQQDYQDDLNDRKQKEFSALAEKINNSVKALAQREKYDAIFQSAVYINPKLDLTDRIIKEVNGSK